MKITFRIFYKSIFAIVFCGIFFLSLTRIIKAETYCDTAGDLGNCYVDGSVTSSGDGKTPATAFKTIQEAADVVGPGDTVNVRGGIVYSTTNNCGPDISIVCIQTSGNLNNSITYQAWPNTGTPVIDGSDAIQAFNLRLVDDIVIKDFKIINGGANTLEGTRTNIYIVTINGNISIYNNTLVDGINGINGMSAYNDNTIRITNNSIINSKNDSIYLLQMGLNTQITNNIIVNSTVGIADTGDNPTLENNLFWNNTYNYGGDIDHSNDLPSQDPRFIDPENGNYRLKFNSPARDAGVALTEVPRDIVGTDRPFGEGVDIGAYETRHFYVDGSSGSDSENGQTPDTAWRTMQHAADTMVAGDIVNVKGEFVYDDIGSTNCIGSSGLDEPSIVCLANSGRLDANIIFQKWQGTGIPIIDAKSVNTGVGIKSDHIIINGFYIKNTATKAPNKNNTAGIFIIGNNIHIQNTIIENSYTSAITSLFNSDSTFKNNLFYKNSIGIATYYNPSPPIIKNNIFLDNETGINDLTTTTIISDYNLFYNNQSNYNDDSGARSHDIMNQDPQFVDLSNGNFKLKSNSPAIDTGETLTEVDTDILGISRPQGASYDIGAFEYYDVSVSLNELTPDPTNNNSPLLSGSATTANGTVSQVKYSLNNGDWIVATASDGNFNSSSENYKIQLKTLADGEYTIQVKAIDSYGNETSPNDYDSDTFVVDTTAPDPRLTQLGTLAVTLDNVNGAHWYYTGTKPKFIGTSEALSTTKFIIEEVDSKDISVSSEGSWDYENQLSTNTYKISFLGQDAAGNVSGTQSFLLTIDPTAQSFPDYIKERLGVGMTTDDIGSEGQGEESDESDEEDAGLQEELIIEQENGDLYEAEEVPEDTDSQPSVPEEDPGSIGGQSIFQQATFWILCVLPLVIAILLVIILMIRKQNKE